MIDPARKRVSRHVATFVVLYVTIPAASALAFFGGFDGIVFDPSNYFENLRQAAALVEQVERAAAQIRLQRRMLARLPASVADALREAGNGVHQRIAAGISEPGLGFAGDWTVLHLRYPIDHSGLAPSWLDTMRPNWTQSERASIAREREFAAHVQQEMAPTSQRLATLVAASNGAGRSASDSPGQMATLQAQEELLALCSGEFDKLLGLRTLRARRNMTTSARRQAVVAYQTERRAAFMNDWTLLSEKTRQAVNSPFATR